MIVVIIAGILMLASDARGLDWMVPDVLFSYVDVFVQAWVLLIGSNR